MKHTSTVRAIATAAVLTTLITGCTWTPLDQPDDSVSAAMGGGTQGATGSSFGGDSPECLQYQVMTSESTPIDQQALMEQYMRRMTPAMRDRHMSQMRQACGTGSQRDIMR